MHTLAHKQPSRSKAKTNTLNQAQPQTKCVHKKKCKANQPDSKDVRSQLDIRAFLREPMMAAKSGKLRHKITGDNESGKLET